MNGELILGNAYELIKTLPDKSVDLIVTDPPYLIKGLREEQGGILKGRNKSVAKELAERKANFLESIDLSILGEFVRVMKKINIYLWCNKEQICDYLTYFVKERNCNFEFIIFAKTNPPPFTCGHYLKDKEYCLFFWEQGAPLKGSFETMRTVYLRNANVADKELYGHPTIKPQDIIENLIRNSSVRGGLILDPFMGSGTTAVACERLERRWIGFEIDEQYYNIALDRLRGVTKKDKANGYEQLKLI